MNSSINDSQTSSATVKRPVEIGLLGYAGSGKDTAADALVRIGYHRASFAAPLKDICRALGWDGLKDPSGRKLLQEIGCSMRHYKESYWVDIARNSTPEEFGPFVWTDVRFENEAQMIRDRGGKIIRIMRPLLPTDEMYNHESEKSVSDVPYDHLIVNGGSVDELHAEIREYVRNL